MERRVARRLARWELNDRLALEASKMDEVWRSLLSQLLWLSLKKLSALNVLPQRPVWHAPAGVQPTMHCLSSCQ